VTQPSMISLATQLPASPGRLGFGDCTLLLLLTRHWAFLAIHRRYNIEAFGGQWVNERVTENYPGFGLFGQDPFRTIRRCWPRRNSLWLFLSRSAAIYKVSPCTIVFLLKRRKMWHDEVTWRINGWNGPSLAWDYCWLLY
jgi:hypothetical protein